MDELAGQTAIITGASRGIGRAIALELARRGAAVVVNYLRRQDAAERTVDEIVAAGGRAVAVQADVRCEEAVARMVRETIARFGQVDILVANAGVTRDGLALAMSVEDWDQVVNANLRGAFLSIREAAPHMMERRSGCIVTVSSVNARRGGRGQANYAASKAGLEAMTRALAIELGPKGIRVNAVAPGLMETEMTASIRERTADGLVRDIPLRRYGVPEDAAHAVAFLVSKDASYITGAVLPVSGGLEL